MSELQITDHNQQMALLRVIANLQLEVESLDRDVAVERLKHLTTIEQYKSRIHELENKIKY